MSDRAMICCPIAYVNGRMLLNREKLLQSAVRHVQLNLFAYGQSRFYNAERNRIALA